MSQFYRKATQSLVNLNIMLNGWGQQQEKLMAKWLISSFTWWEKTKSIALTLTQAINVINDKSTWTTFDQSMKEGRGVGKSSLDLRSGRLLHHIPSLWLAAQAHTQILLAELVWAHCAVCVRSPPGLWLASEDIMPGCDWWRPASVLTGGHLSCLAEDCGGWTLHSRKITDRNQVNCNILLGEL